MSTFTSVSACIPPVAYSTLNHHYPSSVVSAPGNAGYTYGMVSHDGNVSGSAFDHSHSNGMYNRLSHNRGGSQLGYGSSSPLPLPPRSAVSHTLPYVRSSSTPGNSASYLMHRYHSSSSESETTQFSHNHQQGDPSSPLVEAELPPPLPPKPQRSLSADGGGPVYMNSGVLPVPPRTRVAAETNTVL